MKSTGTYIRVNLTSILCRTVIRIRVVLVNATVDGRVRTPGVNISVILVVMKKRIVRHVTLKGRSLEPIVCSSIIKDVCATSVLAVVMDDSIVQLQTHVLPVPGPHLHQCLPSPVGPDLIHIPTH